MPMWCLDAEVDMSESRWIIQVEKTCENKLFMRCCGQFQLELKPSHGIFIVSCVVALINYVYVWPLWH